MAKELDYKKMWESLIKNKSGLDGIFPLFVNDIVNALNDQGFTFDGGHIVPIETEVNAVSGQNENQIGGQKGGQKPKFKEGDWVVWDGFYHLIEGISSEGYICEKGKIAFEVEKDLHLWSIADAKDGDVLYLQKDGKEHIIIYKGVIKERFRTFVSAYCAYNGIVEDFCFVDVSRYIDIAYGGIMPATKEQCDTLFAKMKEAGYEWDAEKKELKKIEQKYADKVESKFKVDDWVILTAGELSTTLQIVKVDTNKRLYWFNDSSYLPIVDEECLHLWTIDDAKDGDVLVDENGEMPFIFKECKYNHIYCYCGYTNLRDLFLGGVVDSEDEELHWLNLYNEQAYPATKEQRDLLFQKMHEAGYEWDAEKKELKKIEQKSSWSDEDWNEIENIACYLDNTDNPDMAKSLRNLRRKAFWKPSDKQITWLYRAADMSDKDSRMKQVLNELLEQLKAL